MNLHGSWGKRSSEPEYEDYEIFAERLAPQQQLESPMESPEKKAWSSLHGAWGKRPAKQPRFNSENAAGEEA
ncbi:unnamed protein product [Leptidea sinapis]|uniref:Uncharacterized protein n=1 Tax=Leptidea sinapis TaxID=189913 RepID=A0A5E4R5P4_9NEOP|nr:unnamed protein product [Leptidea sinapis]